MRTHRSTFVLLGTALAMSVGAQNVGINYDGTAPTMMLDVKTNVATDGIKINNTAVNGSPIIGWERSGTRHFTLGVDGANGNRMVLGSTNLTTAPRFAFLTNGRIGMNTVAPSWLFHMTRGTYAVGASATMALFENTDANGVALSAWAGGAANAYNAFEGVTWYSGTTNTPNGVFGLHIYQNAAINSPGQGVFGQSNEWQGTGVFGSRFNSLGADLGWGGVFLNDLGYTGFFGLASDGNLKTDVHPIPSGLTLIEQLNPVTYYYRTDEHPHAGLGEGLQYGFVAQELQAVLPQLVKEKYLPMNGAAARMPNEPVDLDLQPFLTIDQTRLIPILVKAVQEQQARIEALEQQLNELKPKPNDPQR